MPDNQDYAVVVKGVTKRFASGDFYIDALKGVDLIAKKGEVLMIVGPSGSGKTTLLSTIAGTLRFDEGEVSIYEYSLGNLDDKRLSEFRRNNIGFIFQQYHLIKTLNVAENVSIPLLLNGVNKQKAMEKSIELLSKVGLKGKAFIKTTHLSTGEQQRVAIARALVHQPPLVICDEPTAALDTESGLRVMKLLIEVARAPNRCVVVVTHDNRIFKYADLMVHMKDGLIYDNNPYEI